MFFIHVNDTVAPYTDLIFELLKLWETRPKDTLGCFVDQRVGVIRTGKGLATIMGTVEIAEKRWCNKEEFEALREWHRVPKGSIHDIGESGGKWCYRLKNARKLDKPIVIGSKGFTGNRVYRELDDLDI